MLNLPKFEKCAGKDDLRESMQYISMERDYTVVTDAYKLLWMRSDYPTDLLEFIESEGSIYIHAEQWKKVSGKDVEFVAVDKHALVFKDSKKGQKIFLEYITKNTAGFRYPDWKSVLPVDLHTKKARFETTPVNVIGLDVNYFKDIQDAWNMGKYVTYRMDFFGPLAILITQNNADHLHWSEEGAILMPSEVRERESWLPTEKES